MNAEGANLARWDSFDSERAVCEERYIREGRGRIRAGERQKVERRTRGNTEAGDTYKGTRKQEAWEPR